MDCGSCQQGTCVAVVVCVRMLPCRVPHICRLAAHAGCCCFIQAPEPLSQGLPLQAASLLGQPLPCPRRTCFPWTRTCRLPSCSRQRGELPAGS